MQQDNYMSQQPYFLSITNSGDEYSDAIVFGGIHPIRQNESILINTTNGISYQDLLITLFLQKTEAQILIKKIDGYDFKEEDTLELICWDGFGNKLVFSYSFGSKYLKSGDYTYRLSEKRIIKKNNDDYYIVGSFTFNALTHIRLKIPPKSSYYIFLYPISIEKENFIEDVFKILNTDNFKNLISDGV